MKGRFGGVCRQEQRGKEAWHGMGQVKKYESGTGNLTKFSWKEPTGGNGALAKLNRKIKKLCVVEN